MADDPLTNTAIDDLFRGDFSDLDDDPFNDKPTTKDTRDDKAVLSPRSSLKRKADDNDNEKENFGLGLDEEVRIAKKRRPIAKLDEARLLTEPGIPKLRTITREGQLAKKLRIKGKGHEFTDAARLLNHFQLWLDNLYPRAKFADALKLVEKAGHTKRMQVMRSEWINEGKPGYRKYDNVEVEVESQHDEPDLFGSAQATAQASTNASGQSDPLFDDGIDDDALFIPDANRPSHTNLDDEPDDDELDALLAAQDDMPHQPSTSNAKQTRDEFDEEDDLDALLADQEVRHSQPRAPIQPAPVNNEDGDDDEDEDALDALLVEQETRHSRSNQVTPRASTTTTTNQIILRKKTLDQEPKESYDEDEDADDLNELTSLPPLQRPKSSSNKPEPTLPTPQPTSSPDKPQTPRSSNNNHNDYNNNIQPYRSTMFSSSPVPNNPEEVGLDDLDALLASQEERILARARAREQEREADTVDQDIAEDRHEDGDTNMDDGDNVSTPKATGRAGVGRLFSSSPVPNAED